MTPRVDARRGAHEHVPATGPYRPGAAAYSASRSAGVIVGLVFGLPPSSTEVGPARRPPVGDSTTRQTEGVVSDPGRRFVRVVPNAMDRDTFATQSQAQLGRVPLHMWDRPLAFIRGMTTSGSLAVQAIFQPGDHPIGRKVQRCPHGGLQPRTTRFMSNMELHDATSNFGFQLSRTPGSYCLTKP
jgi:hypothetical protein